jgi:hypothetical protein
MFGAHLRFSRLDANERGVLYGCAVACVVLCELSVEGVAKVRVSQVGPRNASRSCVEMRVGFMKVD